MKILFVAALLSLSTAAFAMPTVGDYARYDGTVTQASSTIPATVEQEIVGQNGTQYDVKQTQTVQGQTQSSEKWTDAKDLLSDQQVSQVLAYCSALGGTADTVATATGNIAACAIPLQDQTGTVWLGAVPFGLVKITRTVSGQSIALTISNFRAGH